MRETEGYIPVPGGQVYYKEFGTDDKPPLVILHGGPGYPHDYLLPLSALGSQRRIIFYDQLGCGLSEKPRDKNLWKIERFVEELGIVISRLCPADYHLLGHSWGTMLATDFVLSEGKNIKSLVLAGPCLSVSRFEQDTQKLINQLPEKTSRLLKKCQKEQMWDTDQCDEAYEVYRKNFDCTIVPNPVEMEKSEEGFSAEIYETMWGENEFVVTGNLKAYERVNRLGQITVPTLFTCGRRDECTPEATKFYSEHLPNSQMVVFRHSAHLPHLEETELYLATIRKFLAAHD